MDQFQRTELIIGKENVEKLHSMKVVVFGCGGVGSYVIEALARVGVGHFILVDDDTVCVTNINRQLFATNSTIGQYKVDVAEKRILDINPKAKVKVIKEFFLPDSKNFFDESIDYIVDAIDTVTAKIEIIMRASNLNIPVISALGTGNKLNPTMLEVADIYSTTVCPLAKVMRKELKARGIEKLKVVYSKEQPIKPAELSIEDNKCPFDIDCMQGLDKSCSTKTIVPGSISFVPSTAGLIIASEVVKDYLNI